MNRNSALIFFLILVSGMLNLTSQSIYLKLISVSQGDLYSTQASVILIFIVGAAIGSLLSSRVVRFLPLIELLTGTVPLLLWLSFPSWNLPLWVIQIGMLLVAIATGTHIPLYAIYAEKFKFSFVYFGYHVGAVLSLLAVEWYFIEAGSISRSLLTLGFLQVGFGIFFSILNRRHSVQTPHEFKTEPFGSWLKSSKTSIAYVFMASSLSFYNVFEAFREQIVINEPFRMHATLISAALLFWMSVAGSLSDYLHRTFVRRISIELLFLLMSSTLFIQKYVMSFYKGIERVNDGTLGFYFLGSLLLALLLTLPSLFSALVFNSEVALDERSAKAKQQQKWSAGRLGFFAALANLAGYVAAAAFASRLFQPSFLTLPLAFFIIFCLAKVFGNNRVNSVRAIFLIAILVCQFLLSADELVQIMSVKVGIGQRPCVQVESVDLTANAYSIQAILAAKVNRLIPMFDRANIMCASTLDRYHLFTIDGHSSHVMEMQQELRVGVMSGVYSPIEGWRKSLVIGIGSGQSSLGVSQISQFTDLVDIAPVTVERLNSLKEENGNLAERKNIRITIDDGYGFTKACRQGPYDFLLNTSTYPSNFNASKLYSDEFVANAKQCLNANGVYETYFDSTVVNSSESAAIFLKPIIDHFETVDIYFQPYPIVFAYDGEKKKRAFSVDFAIMKADRSYLKQREKIIFPSKCQTFVRLSKQTLSNWISATPLTSIDRAHLETVAVHRYVEQFYKPLHIANDILAILAKWPGAQVLNNCEPTISRR